MYFAQAKAGIPDMMSKIHLDAQTRPLALMHTKKGKR
jgi:hypothetical protein